MLMPVELGALAQLADELLQRRRSSLLRIGVGAVLQIDLEAARRARGRGSAAD